MPRERRSTYFVGQAPWRLTYTLINNQQLKAPDSGGGGNMDSLSLGMTIFGAAVQWTALSACVAVVTAIISVLLLAWQIREARRATHAQGWVFLMNHLQNDDARTARRKLFELDEKGIDNLSPDERLMWKELAEKACHRYDCVGVLAKYKWFPRKRIIDTYRYSISKTWSVTSSLVKQYQSKRGAGFWSHFEWLAKQVEKETH